MFNFICSETCLRWTCLISHHTLLHVFSVTSWLWHFAQFYLDAKTNTYTSLFLPIIRLFYNYLHLNTYKKDLPKKYLETRFQWQTELSYISFDHKSYTLKYIGDFFFASNQGDVDFFNPHLRSLSNLRFNHFPYFFKYTELLFDYLMSSPTKFETVYYWAIQKNREENIHDGDVTSISHTMYWHSNAGGKETRFIVVQDHKMNDLCNQWTENGAKRRKKKDTKILSIQKRWKTKMMLHNH